MREYWKNKVKDPMSALTHFMGFLIAIPLMFIMVMKAYEEASAINMLSFAIYGMSLILLYGASTIYHTLQVSPEKTELLRRIDHMMIFVLIAGTYTPVCLIPLRGKWGWTLLAIVWFFALAGIILKIVWSHAPRWLSTAIYVVMGWVVIIAFIPLKQAIPWEGILLLIAGGVTYTLGAVIYALKWPKIQWEFFGFHEIFHLFVLGGSAFHLVFMFQYIL